MIQLIFFGLFIITLIAGAFTYFVPVQKKIDPMKFMMENSGFDSLEVSNHKQTQQFNMTTNQGLIKIRGEMDDLALEQNKFLDTIQDQQQVLKNTGKEANDIMLVAQQEGKAGNQDILKLKALASEMQDEQRLLVAHGQDLLVLSDQLTKNRKWIADQIDLANINTESSLNSLQQRYVTLNDQAADFFDKVSQHNHEVSDQIGKMQDQINGLASNAAYDSAVQQQNAKDNMERMMDKEHENMMQLSESEERSRSLLKDAQMNFVDSDELIKDKLQETQDKIAEEHQNAQDQQWINQQREADQKQRMQDQQDLQNR